MLNHTSGTYSDNGVIDFPRFPISEMHLGNFQDSLEVQSWKVNFKTAVCSKSADPHLTMQWIKEVEIAKSVDDLMTSQSTTGRRDFPDCEMLDALIASALKSLLDKHVHFPKRVSVDEQRAQKYDRFLRGRQIAYMIYEHFRATGAYAAVQGLSDFFSIRLQNDDVLDFDVRWDQALLAASEHLQKWSWRVYTSENCRILFNLGPLWLCTIKKPFETMGKQVLHD